jgi:molybdenum cofactor cytidylyltransferase
MADDKASGEAPAAHKAPAARATSHSFVSGVVLAAGSSTRMGCPKQLLPLGDRPLLRHVVDAALASCLDEVVLVLGHRAREIERGLALPAGGRVRVAVNSDYARGQSGSLRLGLRSTSRRAAAAAILLGDQPGVSARVIDRVVGAFRAAGGLAARPEYATVGKRRLPGHPVLLARRIWPELDELRGDEGARALLAARPEWLLAVEMEGEPPGDIDTPADYRRALDGAC